VRTVTAPELALLEGQRQNDYLRLEIKGPGGAWVDFSSLGGKDYVIGVRLAKTVDEPVWSMQASLKRDGEVATESLSPLRGDSTLNVGGPAINAAREWRVTTAVTADGVAPSAPDWKELCAGYLDKPDFTNDPLTVEGRSVGVRLMDTTIRVRRTYEGSFEDVAQQIVTDNLPTPVPTLYIPDPPDFTVTEFIPYQVSVMDALVTLALSTGWMVTDVYDPSDGVMKTGIIDPNRTLGTAHATISPMVYLTVDQASLDVSTIRNVIEGEWVDAVTGEVFTLTVTDPASIAAFGGVERYMKFSEDATSPIDTGAEMLDMLNAALSDLSTPNLDHVVTSTFFWPAELADLYDFTGNAVHYDTTQRLATFGIVHEFSAGHATTQLTSRGKPSGAFMEWIRRQGGGPTGPEIPPATVINWMVAEGTQYGGTADEVDGAIWFGFTLPEGVDEMRTHVLLGDGPNLAVPSIIDPTTHAVTIRRPDGDVGAQPEYGSIAILSTDTNFYKRTATYSVRGGLTSRPVVAPTDGAIQAVDPVPMVVEGTVASQSVVRGADGTNTVTVTPGTLEPSLGMNYVCITRNKQILLTIPIGTSTAPVVFLDSGLDPSKSSSYSYDSFIGNLGPTWFVTGRRRSTIVEAPTIAAPEFANGTPIAASLAGAQRIQIDWTATTPGAGAVRVEASVDGTTWRVVGQGALASGTVYDTVLGPKLYRLVAIVVLTGDVIATSPNRWFTGLPGPLANPGAIPAFTNSTPKVAFSGITFPTASLVLEISWACATPGAGNIAIMRSTAGSGGPFTAISMSTAVSSGTYRSPDSTYAATEAWYKLEARNLLGVIVVASSAVVHYVPPS
jgi:hypothetical protein